MITNFSELLVTASNQDQPQRLLFLFAKAQNEAKTKNKQSGTISPVMCVDKLPEEMTSFKDFIKEADAINKDWNFIIIAGLNGTNGQTPTPEDAETHLNNMTKMLASGQNLSQFVIFDRDENPVSISLD